jgi:hypothetical protein
MVDDLSTADGPAADRNIEEAGLFAPLFCCPDLSTEPVLRARKSPPE